MAVETDMEGRAVRVVFFQASAAGETRHAWIAPVEGTPQPEPVLVVRPGRANVRSRARSHETLVPA
jgi:hypothetical protein